MATDYTILDYLLLLNQYVIVGLFVSWFATQLVQLLGRICAPLAAPLARCAKHFAIALMRKQRDKLVRKYTAKAVAKFGIVATIAAVASVCLVTRYLSPETRLVSTDPRHKHWNMFIEGILYEPTEKRQRRRDELRPRYRYKLVSRDGSK